MRTGWVVVALLLSACKESPKQRASEVAKADTFWPEAPKPTRTTGKRVLRYQPANVGRLRIAAEGGTPAGAAIAVDFDMTLDIATRAGSAPHERDTSIEQLALRMTAGPMRMKMRIDRDGMVVEDESGTTRFTREEPGPFDVAGMTEQPFTTLVFEDDRRLVTREKAEHPFQALGTGDMLDSALVLFPDLPADAIAAGERWTTTRNTPVGTAGSRADVTYEMTYLGDGACPSGAPSCAAIGLSAGAKDVQVKADSGRTGTASFGIAGKMFLDLDRGILDESRLRMDADVSLQGVALAIGATYTVSSPR